MKTAPFGWTVVKARIQHKTKQPFFVYKRDDPADEKHLCADLAEFTHSSKAKAIAAGKLGQYAYKEKSTS